MLGGSQKHGWFQEFQTCYTIPSSKLYISLTVRTGCARSPEDSKIEAHSYGGWLFLQTLDLDRLCPDRGAVPSQRWATSTRFPSTRCVIHELLTPTKTAFLPRGRSFFHQRRHLLREKGFEQPLLLSGAPGWPSASASASSSSSSLRSEVWWHKSIQNDRRRRKVARNTIWGTAATERAVKSRSNERGRRGRALRMLLRTFFPILLGELRASA